MKKLSELMQEMGFREDASQGAKEAFIKHLIKSAHGVEIETPSDRRAQKTKQWLSKQNEAPEQLSFDLVDPKKVV